MWWIYVLISEIGVFLFWKEQNNLLLIIGIIVLIGTVGSYGIMHNYATDEAKKRSSYIGGFNDFTTEEVESIPNWITSINMIMSIIGIILLVISVLIILSIFIV